MNRVVEEVPGFAPLFPQQHVTASTFNPLAAARDLEAAEGRFGNFQDEAY